MHPTPGRPAVERQRWPDRAAPLIGAAGGAIAGLGIQLSTDLVVSPALTVGGGAGPGFVGGLVVWIANRQRRAREQTAPAVSPSTAMLAAPWAIPTPEPSRWGGVLAATLAVGMLLANHASVTGRGEKHFPLVLGGSVMLTCGWLRVAWPGPTAYGATSYRPAWLPRLEAACGLAGLGLAACLWLLVY